MKRAVYLAWLLFAPNVWAQGDDYSGNNLEGVTGFRVIVSDVASDLEQAGITRSDIATDVELRLRMAGLPLLSETEARGSDEYWQSGRPLLHVITNGIKIPGRPDCRVGCRGSVVFVQFRFPVEDDGDGWRVMCWEKEHGHQKTRRR